MREGEERKGREEERDETLTLSGNKKGRKKRKRIRKIVKTLMLSGE